MSDKAINRCEPAPAQKLSKAPEANNTIPRGPLYYWHNLCYTMAAWGKPWQPGDSDYTSASLTSLLSKVEPAVLLYLAIGPALDHTEEGNPLFFKPNSIYHPTYRRWWEDGVVSLYLSVENDKDRFPRPKNEYFRRSGYAGGKITVSGRTLGQQHWNDQHE